VDSFKEGECASTTNSYVTYGSGNGIIRRTVVTVTEYNEKGDIIKQTVTETEYEKPVGITYPPYQPYVVSYDQDMHKFTTTNLQTVVD
jgi:hypothetical protein